jgi:hypothetical protein
MGLQANNPLRSIAIVVYNRADLTSKLFDSLSKARDIENHKLVVIQQIGDSEVSNVLNRYMHLIEVLVKVNGSMRNSTQNIAFNRLLANTIAFDSLNSEYVLSLEDDAEISPDSLEFVKEIYFKFHNISKFRGVNLGSQVPFQEFELYSYTRIRYGIHSAHMLSRRSWKYITKKKLINPAYGHFDGAIEHFFKTGFMVTPNNSRYIDNGACGTNTGSDGEGTYFNNLKSSFVGNRATVSNAYIERPVHHNWRRDCIQYESKQNLRFSIQSWVWNHRSNRVVRKVVACLKKLELK